MEAFTPPANARCKRLGLVKKMMRGSFLLARARACFYFKKISDPMLCSSRLCHVSQFEHHLISLIHHPTLQTRSSMLWPLNQTTQD